MNKTKFIGILIAFSWSMSVWAAAANCRSALNVDILVKTINEDIFKTTRDPNSSYGRFLQFSRKVLTENPDFKSALEYLSESPRRSQVLRAEINELYKKYESVDWEAVFSRQPTSSDYHWVHAELLEKSVGAAFDQGYSPRNIVSREITRDQIAAFQRFVSIGGRAVLFWQIGSFSQEGSTMGFNDRSSGATIFEFVRTKKPDGSVAFFRKI